MDQGPYVDDTIVAAATPPGIGGVAIVRVSGPAVPEIAERMIGELPEPNRAVLRTFRSGNQPIDQGIALYFGAPNSFTGEAVLELHAHGGPTIVAALVDAAVATGARRAEPGEFTKRAFLNGKLDLLQAEAVADLIESGTEHAARAALRSLAGDFSLAVHELSEALTQLRLFVEAAIDFPEEEIDFLSDTQLAERIAYCEARIGDVIDNAEAGRLLADGYQIAIAGRPNAGKSSLLNRLSGLDAAIVTDVPGTTRDLLRERVNLEGLAVEFVDTAGLRDEPDPVEAEGIRRARAVFAEADALLWIEDVSADSADEGRALAKPPHPNTLVVRNKIDLTGEQAGTRAGVVSISAATGAGIDALKEAILRLADYGGSREGTFSARRRHLHALERARQHFDTGVERLKVRRAGELFAEELRLAQQALGEITGEVSSDDLLGRIFSEFCIGK